MENTKLPSLSGTENETKAIGLFNQNENRITGTFATETGDYRYLDGVVSGDSVFLSTFDGSHAFLFEAEIKDSLIEGLFLSGTHYSENWIAKKNEDVVLRNPDSLTFYKRRLRSIYFQFPKLRRRNNLIK